MKYIIFLELLVMSMRRGVADTSSSVNLAEEITEMKEQIRSLLTKSADQSVKIAQLDAKIANQDRLIMEHRMSNAVQRNRVLQAQNNLLERSLSTMQQRNDQEQELLSQMARLDAFNETVIEFAKNGHEDIQNSTQQWNNKYEGLLSRINKLETLNETVIEYTKHEYQDIQNSIQQGNNKYEGLLSRINKLETLNETDMAIVRNQSQVNEVPVIAFGASLGWTFTSQEDSAKIVFDTIQINEGNNYHNGVFTAPIPGIYVFQWTLLTSHGKSANSYLVVNGLRKRYNFVNSSSYSSYGFESGSALIPVKLRKGDKVWIIAEQSGYQIYGHETSSFQGWLQSAI